MKKEEKIQNLMANKVKETAKSICDNAQEYYKIGTTAKEFGDFANDINERKMLSVASKGKDPIIGSITSGSNYQPSLLISMLGSIGGGILKMFKK